MKRLSLLLAIAASLAISGAALAGPSYIGKATGGIGMSGPLQYVEFNAFDFGPTGDRGTVNYTNFDYGPVAGTGVWRMSASTKFIYEYGGDWVHSMWVDTIVPTSPTSNWFSGTGEYDGGGGYTWTVDGSIDGSDIEFQIVYTGTSAGYILDAVGQIHADGSITGTATDNWGRSATWRMPAGSAYEVFSYTASVSCARELSPTELAFGFTIPSGVPFAGTFVVAKVIDGGTPGTDGDQWLHGTGGSCDSLPGLTNYPIESGNLVVH